MALTKMRCLMPGLSPFFKPHLLQMSQFWTFGLIIFHIIFQLKFHIVVFSNACMLPYRYDGPK